MDVSLSLSLYIYMYIEREREREGMSRAKRPCVTTELLCYDQTNILLTERYCCLESLDRELFV